MTTYAEDSVVIHEDGSATITFWADEKLAKYLSVVGRAGRMSQSDVVAALLRREEKLRPAAELNIVE